jgi:carbamoyl-phosphate synthase large subunit
MWPRGILPLNFVSISRVCAKRSYLVNILLSSVGRRAYLVDYFRAAVGPGDKVIATNSVADTTGMMAADVPYVVPEAGDGGFIDALLAVCHQHEVGLLFSLHDWEAPFIAAASKRFEETGVVLGVSSPEVLRICLDKYQTFEFCRDRGIPTPLTFLSENEALKACEDGVVGFPLIVKARFGQGSLALHKVYDAQELEAACLLTRAQISRFEDNKLHASNGDPIVVQEFIAGDEYGLDVLNDFAGRFRACLIKRKLAMRAGETDAAVSVLDTELGELGKQIGKSLGHIAMLDADVIVRDRTPYLLELNPRFGGHYPFSHAAGADVPAALVALAEGREPLHDSLSVKADVKSHKDLVLRIVESSP